MRTGTPRQSVLQTRDTIFAMTTPFVIIPSRASESSGEAICRPGGVIIPASRPGSRSAGFSENGNLWITDYAITYQHALIGGPLIPAHCPLYLRCSHAA